MRTKGLRMRIKKPIIRILRRMTRKMAAMTKRKPSSISKASSLVNRDLREVHPVI